MGKRTFLAVLLTLLCLSLFAGCEGNAIPEETTMAPSQINGDTYQWEIQGDVALLVGIGNMKEQDIRIPAKICLVELDGVLVEEPVYGREYPVVVKSDAFVDCQSIKTVTFADGTAVQNDQMEASHVGMFQGCRSLTGVYNIPDTVTSMAYAFYGCEALKEIDAFPAAITDLEGCFQDCVALESAPAIPESVVTIAACFKNCTSLRSVGKISAAATDFSGVFFNCVQLEAAPKLPNTATDLQQCFYGCTALKTVEQLPTQARNLCEIFAYCSSLEKLEISLPAGVTNLDRAFYECTALTSLGGEFPETVTSMFRTFSGCVALESVPPLSYNLFELHTGWQTDCFYKCPSLEEIRVDCCPNISIKNCSFYTKLMFLQEHVADGICEHCGMVTGVFDLEGLDVWFWNIPLNVYEDGMNCLRNEIPKELRNANRCLAVIHPDHWATFLQMLCDYLGVKCDPIWAGNGGINLVRNLVSYAGLRIFDDDHDGQFEWNVHELGASVHELGHGYDWPIYPKTYKSSQTAEWIKIHEAEGDIIKYEYYNVDQYHALAEYDRREETFCMAMEGYFGNPEWLREKCPQMYAYMDALWGKK